MAMHWRLMRRVVTVTAALAFVSPTSAREAQGFVYVAVVSLDCLPAPAACAVPHAVLIVDASTGRVVHRIDLPSRVPPRLITVSPDGSRVYVLGHTSTLGGELAAIDAQRHLLFDTYPISAGADYSRMAIGHDPRLVYFVRQTGSSAEAATFDTRSRSFPAIVVLPSDAPGFHALAASPLADRFYVTASAPFMPDFLQSIVSEYDGVSGVLLSSLPIGSGNGRVSELFMSASGTRLYAVTPATSVFLPTLLSARFPGYITVIDPQVMTVSATWADPVALRFPARVFEALEARRAYVLQPWSSIRTIPDVPEIPARLSVVDIDSGAVLQSAETDPQFVAIAADGSRAFGADPFETATLVGWDLPAATIATLTALSPFAPSKLIATTPPNAPTCSYRLNTQQSSWTVDGGSDTLTLTSGCAWQASSSAPWARLSAASGTGSQTLTLTVDPNYTTTNRSAALTIGGQLVTVTQASFSATPPFGAFDTPMDNATGVEGSLAVTGWVLDDVGVTRVHVYRGAVTGEPANAQIYVGDATFVEGARPDVQALFPNFPNSSRAGWGLSVLTNMLPGGGTGTYTLFVYADDIDGHTTLLGVRVFTAVNATSARPFGTIDTPAQGETVSGVIVNFGWALTPSPNFIPTDGSTIDILIDGVWRGIPLYNQFRPDIAALFPGYANRNGAVGSFILDTTTYANGVHTIAWVVRDNMGNVAGIGSRYFTIANP